MIISGCVNLAENVFAHTLLFVNRIIKFSSDNATLTWTEESMAPTLERSMGR